MKKLTIVAILAAGVILGYTGRVFTQAQTGQKLPVVGYEAAKDIPGAKEMVDPNGDYKVLFDVTAKVKDTEVEPILPLMATYVNTLAKNGVPASHRHIVALFHQGGGDAVFSNEVYKSRHNGADNPNIAILRALADAGVELHVCGQGLLGKKVEQSQLLPGVQADYWALVTVINLQQRGYVKVG